MAHEIRYVRAPGAATRWIGIGIATGIVAGFTFLAFEMVMAWALGKPPIMPLAMIGAILLGGQVVMAATPQALLTGLVLHEGLAAVFGLCFGIVAAIVAAPQRYLDIPGQLAVVGVGTLFGLALWLVNFYAIAPNAFPWFGMTPWWVQLVAHTVLFGTVMGVMSAGFVPGYPAAGPAAARPVGAAASPPVREDVGVPQERRVS